MLLLPKPLASPSLNCPSFNTLQQLLGLLVEAEPSRDVCPRCYARTHAGCCGHEGREAGKGSELGAAGTPAALVQTHRSRTVLAWWDCAGQGLRSVSVLLSVASSNRTSVHGLPLRAPCVPSQRLQEERRVPRGQPRLLQARVLSAAASAETRTAWAATQGVHKANVPLCVSVLGGGASNCCLPRG